MQPVWVVGAVVAVVALLFLHHYRRWKRFGIPGPVGYPIIGATPTVWKNRDRIYDYVLESVATYGHTFGVLVGLREIVCTLDPETCDYFLKKNFKNYEKGKHRKAEFRELLGDGIFTANGDEWKMHRHLAKPLFRTSFIDTAMVPLFISHTDELLHDFDTSAKKKEPIEITKLFMQYTMSTFLSIGLGCTPEMLSKQERIDFATSFDYIQNECNNRGFNPLWRFCISRKFKECVKHVDEVVYRIIALRKKDDEETLKSKTDIFSQFLLTRDANDKPLTDKYLRDVFMNFLLAGRDTTAALLAWTFFELGKNPHIKEKVLEEINEIVKGDIPTAQEIHKLEYTKRMFTEVLRLHPSVPVDGREVVEEDTLPSGHIVRPGASIIYSPYAMGRCEEIYPEPLKFDPERWNEKNVKQIKPGQFTAFHWGPQTCLGKEMAYVEARVVLLMLLRKFDFQLADDPNKTYQHSIILLPQDGMLIQPVHRQ